MSSLLLKRTFSTYSACISAFFFHFFADQGNQSPMDVRPLFTTPYNLITNPNTNNNRELFIVGGLNEGNPTFFDNDSIIGYGGGGGTHPFSGMTNPQQIFANNSNISDSRPRPRPDDVNVNVTGLTTSNLSPISRRRSSDLVSFPSPATTHQFTSNNNNNNPSASSSSSSFNFTGNDMLLQIIQQQQLEMDQLVAMHAEQMKLIILEIRNRANMELVEAVEQRIAMKLRVKEEEIAKIGRTNWDLQEKLKTLYNENQSWKDLAHKNETTVNTLKNNLDQILDQIQARNEQDQLEFNELNAVTSFCSSSSNSINYEGRGGLNGDDGSHQQPRRLPVSGGGGGGRLRLCRRCGTEQSSVLLLPCRHLCVCSACSSSVHICPICQCNKNGSISINPSF